MGTTTTRPLRAKLFAFGAVALLGLASLLSAALAISRSVRAGLRLLFSAS